MATADDVRYDKALADLYGGVPATTDQSVPRCGKPTYPSSKPCVLPADHTEPNLHHAAPGKGEFCHRHFSWLCQAGQGDCQREGADG